MRYQIVSRPDYNYKLAGSESIHLTRQIFTGVSAVKLRDRVMIWDRAGEVVPPCSRWSQKLGQGFNPPFPR